VAGTFNVSLTITDANGQTNSALQQVTVSVPVQANFSAQANGLTVQFTDASTGSISQYGWDFGDGSSAAEQNPQHAYGQAGTYNVTLTVVGMDGTSNSQTQQVTVSAPVQANFSAQPNGLTVQFTDQSTGSITQYLWDFGDGQNSGEQNPQHTYQAAGTYNVTLTVTDSSGQTNSATQQVTASVPLQANFSAQATDLTVQFADQSSGQVAQYVWDFGDGQTSNEQNPQHTYQVAGTFNVSLTITDANGQTNSALQRVTVTEAQQPTQPQQQSIVDTTPVQPDFNALRDTLRGIYANGVNSAGAQASVFTVAGDSVFTLPGILTPFVPGGQYNTGGHAEFQAAIDFFNSTQPSFSRTSLAVNPNFAVTDLLDVNKADPSCNGEAPILCELHAAHPSVMFIAVGSTDARNGTDPGVFQNALNVVVSTVVNNGAIPVLVTLPDDKSSPNLQAINEAIINVAQSNNVPLLNAARALNELPSFNLNAGGIGPGGLGDATNEFGINRLNLILLQVLTDARNIIFPDA
jgi:PKD repeat protein